MKKIMTKNELLEELKEDAIEVVVEKAKEEANNITIDSSEDVLYMRDEMEMAWRKIEAIETAKNAKSIHRMLSHWVGPIKANKIVKL